MNLKQKAINGVKWTSLSAIIIAILQLLQLSILARFLDSSDFGLIAILSVVVGFSQAFLDMGISNAVIHKQTISHVQLSSLYWVNVLAGIFLFSIVYAISPLISNFYNEPNLLQLIRLVSYTFLIQPFGQLFMVLWQKELKFKAIATIEVINKSIALIVSVWFAYYGYGAISLVYGLIFGIVGQTILYIYFGLKYFKPSLVLEIKEIKYFIAFGAYQTGERIVNYFNTQIDVILIGKLLGAEALGVYSLAKQLIMKPMQLINPVLTKVTFPLMAKIQDDNHRLKKIYLLVINLTSSLNFYIYATLFILSSQIISLVFGNNWNDVVPVLQVLSIFGAIRSTGNPVGSLLLAKGKANWGFWWNIGILFFMPLFIYYSSNWGVIGISWGLVIFASLLMLPNWYLLIRPLCFADFLEYFKAILIPLFIVIISTIPIIIISFIYGLNYLNISILFIVQIGVYIILQYFFNKRLFKFFYNLRKKII